VTANAFREESRLQTSIISRTARLYPVTQISTTVHAPEQLDRRVRDELSGYIIPSTQEDIPIVPNFFLAVKGPDGSAAVAKR
jgi:hypothetical protein